MKLRNLIRGAVAGLVGGMVFGMLMGMMGMLPMVAKLVGSNSTLVGLLVHLVNSALIGAAFSVVFGSKARTLSSGAILGLIYGVFWWILGGLIIMPLWLGMPAQLSVAGMKNAMPSLMGHMIYGIVTGLIYSKLTKRKLATVTAQGKFLLKNSLSC